MTGPGPVTLQLNLPVPAGRVSVAIYTTAFRKVAELSLGSMPAGITDVTLNLTDRFGAPLANGLYYLWVQVDGKRTLLKLLILR